MLAGDALRAFDDATKDAVDRLFPGLTPEGHLQASLGAAVGGLGWRRASDIALSANLAALIMATPKVRSMAAAAVYAGLLPSGIVEGKLEATRTDVEAAYLASLDESERIKAEEFISRAKLAAAAQWQQIQQGFNGAVTQAPRADADYSSPEELAPARVPEVHDGGSSDAEGRGRRLSPAHLQKELGKLVDCTKLRALEARLRSQCHWSQLDRLRELRHHEVSHAWLWNLHPKKGRVLTETDYVSNVQKRLGAIMVAGEMACRALSHRGGHKRSLCMCPRARRRLPTCRLQRAHGAGGAHQHTR